MRPVFSRRFGGSLPRLSFAAQSLYDPLSIVARVPPSRCVRCGASSRDALCGACTDYLVAYCPFWLDPALLPGPSLIDLVDPRDVAVCRYLSACGWMPSHLASEYRLRTDVLEHAETLVGAEGTGPLDREPPIESVEPATFEAAAEPSRLPESDEEVVPPLESGP